MYMLVAFLALLAFLGGDGGKSAKNVECAREGWEFIGINFGYHNADRF